MDLHIIGKGEYVIVCCDGDIVSALLQSLLGSAPLVQVQVVIEADNKRSALGR